MAVDTLSIDIGEIQIDTRRYKNIRLRGQLQHEQNQLQLNASTQIEGQPILLSAVLEEKNWRLSSTLSTDLRFIDRLYSIILPNKPEWDLDGMVDVTVNAAGAYSVKQPYFLGIQFRPENISGEIPGLLLAAEKASFQVAAELQLLSNRVSGDVSIELQSGLLAINDILIEPVDGPLSLESSIRYSPGQVVLSDLEFKDPGGLHVKIPKGKIHANDINRHQASIQVVSATFPHVYTAWLQPLLYGTVLEDLETAGKVSAELSIRNSVVQKAFLELEDINVADSQKRFSIYGLNGGYQGDHNLANGRLGFSYTDAELHRLLVGGSQVEFIIADYNASLVKPVSLPLYGGELKIFELAFEGIDSKDYSASFKGVLTPISLASLTHDLGWQSFSGTLSGVIPRVHYHERALKIDGILLARVFDGAFRMKDLYVENFLGLAPVLSADFEVDNLDLDRLTRTFDFGRMEGRLSGYINDLIMSSWQPESFDAFFFTPEDDESPHIISQRAVDNLTSLSGSDIGSVLSRTYLRFLDNFRYEKLGIGCTLKNNVCRMRGIAPAGGSAYYIVKSGLFLPRLDMIGYSQDVDWPGLVSRVKQVLSDNAPVIQ